MKTIAHTLFVLLFLSLIPVLTAEEVAENTASTEATDGTTATAESTATTEDDVVILRNELSEVHLNPAWAEITHFKLLHHHPLALPAAIGGDETLDPEGPLSVLGPLNRNKLYAGHNSLTIYEDIFWSVSSATDKVAVFTRTVDNVVYTLTYTLDDKKPTVHSKLQVSNNGANKKTVPVIITAINGIHQDLAKNDAYFNGIYIYVDDDLESLDFPALDSNEITHYEWNNSKYIALRSRFFAGIWTPGNVNITDINKAETKAQATAGKGNSQRHNIQAQTADDGGLQTRISVDAKAFPGGPLNATQHQVFFNVHIKNAGNKDFTLESQQALEVNWTTTITSMTTSDIAMLSEAEAELEFADWFYNFFRLISDLLLKLLNLLNWAFEKMGLETIAYGLAVICTTAIVKGILHRVTYKQQFSMMKMQQLAPELRRLQAQYKDDRQAMAMKQMELWKKHGVNPFGGCLPLLIQMPIFFALFQVFNHAGDMRGHGFLWVNDLTLPDQFIPLHFNWPILGSPASINLLPLIYLPIALFQSMSMKMTTPNSGDKQKDEMQETMQKMFRFMPIFFFLFIYFFASGLVLYITVSSLWSLIEIRLIRKKLGMDKPKDEKGTGGTSTEAAKKF